MVILDAAAPTPLEEITTSDNLLIIVLFVIIIVAILTVGIVYINRKRNKNEKSN